MKKIILVSHGYFALELKKSIEMIMGSQDNVFTVGLLEGESPEDFKMKLEGIIEKKDDLVIFADLLGGTPCNIASRILMERKYSFILYSGMNMPMIVSYINGILSGISSSTIEDGKSGIRCVNDVLDKI